jgi:hypothetical protein
MTPPRFTEKTFLEWKNNPLNRVFLAFLKEQQSSLAQQWMAGASLSPESQTKAKLMGELSDLSWSDVSDFYDGQEAE